MPAIPELIGVWMEHAVCSAHESDRGTHRSFRVTPMQGPKDVLRSKFLNASSSDGVRDSAEEGASCTSPALGLRYSGTTHR